MSFPPERWYRVYSLLGTDIAAAAQAEVRHWYESLLWSSALRDGRLTNPRLDDKQWRRVESFAWAAWKERHAVEDFVAEAEEQAHIALLSLPDPWAAVQFSSVLFLLKDRSPDISAILVEYLKVHAQ